MVKSLFLVNEPLVLENSTPLRGKWTSERTTNRQFARLLTTACQRSSSSSANFLLTNSRAFLHSMMSTMSWKY